MLNRISELSTAMTPLEIIELKAIRIKILRRCKSDKKGIFLRRAWFKRLLSVKESIAAAERFLATGYYTKRTLDEILLNDFKINLSGNKVLKNKIYLNLHKGKRSKKK